MTKAQDKKAGSWFRTSIYRVTLKPCMEPKENIFLIINVLALEELKYFFVDIIARHYKWDRVCLTP